MSLATVTLSLVWLLIEKVVVAPAVIAIVTGTARTPAAAQPPQPPQLPRQAPPREAGPQWSLARLDSIFFFMSVPRCFVATDLSTAQNEAI